MSETRIEQICVLQSLQLLQQAQALTMLLTSCLNNVYTWLGRHLPQHQAVFEARLQVRQQLRMPHDSSLGHSLVRLLPCRAGTGSLFSI